MRFIETLLCTSSSDSGASHNALTITWPLHTSLGTPSTSATTSTSVEAKVTARTPIKQPQAPTSYHDMTRNSTSRQRQLQLPLEATATRRTGSTTTYVSTMMPAPTQTVHCGRVRPLACPRYTSGLNAHSSQLQQHTPRQQTQRPRTTQADQPTRHFRLLILRKRRVLKCERALSSERSG